MSAEKLVRQSWSDREVPCDLCEDGDAEYPSAPAGYYFYRLLSSQGAPVGNLCANCGDQWREGS